MYWVHVTDFNSCASGDTILVKVKPNVGLHQNPAFNEFKVYPNPSPGIVYIRPSEEIGQEVQIKVTDLTGKVLIQESIKFFAADIEYSIDLSSLKEGIYILSIDQCQVRIIRTKN
jgi:hypothetical protein